MVTKCVIVSVREYEMKGRRTNVCIKKQKGRVNNRRDRERDVYSEPGGVFIDLAFRERLPSRLDESAQMLPLIDYIPLARPALIIQDKHTRSQNNKL